MRSIGLNVFGLIALVVPMIAHSEENVSQAQNRINYTITFDRENNTKVILREGLDREKLPESELKIFKLKFLLGKIFA